MMVPSGVQVGHRLIVAVDDLDLVDSAGTAVELQRPIPPLDRRGRHPADALENAVPPDKGSVVFDVGGQVGVVIPQSSDEPGEQQQHGGNQGQRRGWAAFAPLPGAFPARRRPRLDRPAIEEGANRPPGPLLSGNAGRTPCGGT
jgi:hypothetical protein